MKKLSLLIIVAFLVLVSHAFAAVSFDPGTTYNTTALTGFSTSGDGMDDMSVTAYFIGGGSQAASWADTGSGAGAAIGTGWSLAEAGDTFGGTWTLSNSTGALINRILIDGQPGSTVFDIDWTPYPGTDGSANGLTFTPTYGGTVNATYRDRVALTGFAPVGDLYLRLDIEFPNGFDSGAGTMTFKADTDSAATKGDIHKAPEPATIFLIGFGLIGLAGAKRRFER